MKNKTLSKIFIILFLALLPSSFVYASGNPEVFKATVEGVGKLIGMGAKAASKIIEDKSPGAAKAFDTLSDIAYGATGQNYEDHMRQTNNLKEGEPLPNHLRQYRWDQFPITFINQTEYTILIKGFGISKELQRIREPDKPTELILENRNPYRSATDYELIYDKNIIYYEIEDILNDDDEGHPILRKGAIITFMLKEIDGNYEETYESDINNKTLTENKTEENIDHTPHNDRDISNNVTLNNNRNTNDIKSEENKDSTLSNNGAISNNVSNSVSNSVSLNNKNKLEENVNSLIESSISIESAQSNIPTEINAPLPLINNFQTGKYYIQIGSYTNVNTVYSEIAKIGDSFPVVVMKTNVIIKGKDTLVHRVLIGPLNYDDSQYLFHKFKATYNDAFVWYGR